MSCACTCLQKNCRNQLSYFLERSSPLGQYPWQNVEASQERSLYPSLISLSAFYVKHDKYHESMSNHWRLFARKTTTRERKTKGISVPTICEVSDFSKCGYSLYQRKHVLPLVPARTQAMKVFKHQHAYLIFKHLKNSRESKLSNTWFHIIKGIQDKCHQLVIKLRTPFHNKTEWGYFPAARWLMN